MLWLFSHLFKSPTMKYQLYNPDQRYIIFQIPTFSLSYLKDLIRFLFSVQKLRLSNFYVAFHPNIKPCWKSFISCYHKTNTTPISFSLIAFTPSPRFFADLIFSPPKLPFVFSSYFHFYLLDRVSQPLNIEYPYLSAVYPYSRPKPPCHLLYFLNEVSN